jgi:shikimate kinase
MECDGKIPDPSPASPVQGIDARLAAAALRPVALVGLMGAGKTTVGRRLAARLTVPFVDADAEIEEASGLSVSEIFERFGEAHFRDGERRVIARLVDGAPKVIATGGGAFMQADTRALLLERAVIIWLDADIQTLVERVRRRNTRPLLKGRDPGEVLTALAAVRNPVYAQAHIRVPSKSSPHGDTVDAIIAALVAANSPKGEP